MKQYSFYVGSIHTCMKTSSLIHRHYKGESTLCTLDLYESWSHKRENYCAWWAQPYAENSHLITSLINIFICDPFTRNCKNILDVPSIIKPIYDVKALTFDEA